MGNSKNNVRKSFFITILIIIILLCLFFLPRINFFGNYLKRIDIIEDILDKDSLGNTIAELRMDSLEGVSDISDDKSESIEIMQTNYQDSIPDGMIAIEDFADSTGVHREMDKFYRALDSSHDRQVRIAFFGDSYIEGDILTSALRDTLQSQYGGRGVGWVEVSCISEHFRNTVNINNSGWESHCARVKKDYSSNLASIAGSYFIPLTNASLTLTCQNNKYGKRLSWVDEISIFADMSPSLSLQVRLNDTIPSSHTSDGTSGMQRFTHSGNISKVNITASGRGTVYGVSMDGKTGICLDNFSLRGGDGTYISSLSQSMLSRMSELRSYDLIILEYGLNTASSKRTNYGDYTNRLASSIDLLKSTFPKSSILILGCSDRGQNGKSGKTMRGVVELIKYQRKLASDEHIAFWDIRESLGGEGAISDLCSKNMAAKDLTHINFKGGEYLAQHLYDVLMNGKMNYDRRRINR